MKYGIVLAIKFDFYQKMVPQLFKQKLKNFEVNKLNDYDFLVAITDRDLKNLNLLVIKMVAYLLQ